MPCTNAHWNAQVDTLTRFGDVPGMDVPDESRSRVMHAMLIVGGGVVMLSDSMPGMPVGHGANTHVCLQFDDLNDMARKFDALAEGGTVTMALHDAFWGDRFGMLTDQFGICWMFTCPTTAAG